MSSPTEPTPDDATEAAGSKTGGKRKLILLAAPVLLGGIGAGLWFSGIIPKMLGTQEASQAQGNATPAAESNATPVFVELPEIVANLNSGTRKTTYVKLKARLEVGSAADSARVLAVMPRLLDMFQTYIREMWPDELRGSAGTYRLREELVARAQLAAAPARVRDVLFIEVLIQ